MSVNYNPNMKEVVHMLMAPETGALPTSARPLPGIEGPGNL